MATSLLVDSPKNAEVSSISKTDELIGAINYALINAQFPELPTLLTSANLNPYGIAPREYQNLGSKIEVWERLGYATTQRTIDEGKSGGISVLRVEGLRYFVIMAVNKNNEIIDLGVTFHLINGQPGNIEAAVKENQVINELLYSVGEKKLVDSVVRVHFNGRKLEFEITGINLQDGSEYTKSIAFSDGQRSESEVSKNPKDNFREIVEEIKNLVEQLNLRVGDSIVVGDLEILKRGVDWVITKNSHDYSSEAHLDIKYIIIPKDGKQVTVATPTGEYGEFLQNGQIEFVLDNKIKQIKRIKKELEIIQESKKTVKGRFGHAIKRALGFENTEENYVRRIEQVEAEKATSYLLGRLNRVLKVNIKNPLFAYLSK